MSAFMNVNAKNLSRHQKLVLETMYECNQAWFSAEMFSLLCGFQRPILTMRSLKKRGFLRTKVVKQFDVEPFHHEDVDTGAYGFTRDGVKWVEKRFARLERLGYVKGDGGRWSKTT